MTSGFVSGVSGRPAPGRPQQDWTRNLVQFHYTSSGRALSDPEHVMDLGAQAREAGEPAYSAYTMKMYALPLGGIRGESAKDRDFVVQAAASLLFKVGFSGGESITINLELKGLALDLTFPPNPSEWGLPSHASRPFGNRILNRIQTLTSQGKQMAPGTPAWFGCSGFNRPEDQPANDWHYADFLTGSGASNVNWALDMWTAVLPARGRVRLIVHPVFAELTHESWPVALAHFPRLCGAVTNEVARAFNLELPGAARHVWLGPGL